MRRIESYKFWWMFPTTYHYKCDFPGCKVQVERSPPNDWLLIKARRDDSTIWSKDLYWCPKHNALLENGF